MAVKHKSSGKEMPMAAAIAIGILCSILLTFLGAAVLAYLIAGGSVAQNGIGYGAMLILAVCSAMGAWLASRFFRRLRLMVCGLTGLGYYLCLLAMTALFFGGQYSGLGITALMILLGTGISLLPFLLGKGRKTKHKIPAYR